MLQSLFPQAFAENLELPFQSFRIEIDILNNSNDVHNRKTPSTMIQIQVEDLRDP